MVQQLDDQFNFSEQPRSQRQAQLPSPPETEPRGIEYFGGYADELFAGPEPLSQEEQSRLHRLSVREAELQPTQRFVAGSPAPRTAGTFGIDTRQALTGISDLILSLEDRRRFDQLHGSPERQARLESKAERLEDRGERRLERPEDPSLLQRVTGPVRRGLGRRDLRRAESAREEVPRYEGISEELAGLRGRQEASAEVSDARRQFLETQAEAELDFERAQRGEIPLMQYEQRLNRNLEDLRHQNRLELEETRQEGREILREIEQESADPQSNREYAATISAWSRLPEREAEAINKSIEQLEELVASYGDSLPADEIKQHNKNIEELRGRRRKAQRLQARILMSASEGKVASDEELMNDIDEFFRQDSDIETGIDETDDEPVDFETLRSIE